MNTPPPLPTQPTCFKEYLQTKIGSACAIYRDDAGLTRIDFAAPTVAGPSGRGKLLAVYDDFLTLERNDGLSTLHVPLAMLSVHTRNENR